MQKMHFLCTEKPACVTEESAAEVQNLIFTKSS